MAAMPRILSLSALNERLAMAMAVGLRSRISAHQRPTSGSSWSCGTTALTTHPERQRLLRRVTPAQIPDFARLLFPYHAREISGSETGIDRADLRADLAEHGLFRGDGKIAKRGDTLPPPIA